MASSKHDSIYIYETEGNFYPTDQEWRGQGGKVTWDRFGDKIEAHAILADYRLDVKRSLYEAKNATLYYPLYFGAKGIKGTFGDKLILPNSSVGGTYPRFESNDQFIPIDNFGEGIEFTGAFKISGELIYGLGRNANKAEIKIYNDQNNLVFKGAGESKPELV